jgi:hypothetical protein
MRLDALLNIDKGLPPWAYIKKSNAANDPPSLVHKQMRSRTLFDGSAPRTAYVLFAPSTLTRCFDALKRSESAIQIQMRPKIPLTPGIGHLLEKATGILQPVL